MEGMLGQFTDDCGVFPEITYPQSLTYLKDLINRKQNGKREIADMGFETGDEHFNRKLLVYPPTSFLISFSFIKASTGVRVLISILRMSSLICWRSGSFS